MANDLFQWLSVAAILIVVILYIIRRLRRRDKGCGCGCDNCNLKNNCHRPDDA